MVIISDYKWLSFSPALKDLLFPDFFTSPTTNKQNDDNTNSHSESSTGAKKKAGVHQKCLNLTDPEVRTFLQLCAE